MSRFIPLRAAKDVADGEEQASCPPAGQIISTTCDGAPPAVNVDASIQADDVRVAWNASDSGSGVTSCVLRVREEQGAWRAQPIACTGVLTYTDVWAGRAYTFNVQATDRAGNTGEASTNLAYRGTPPTVSLSAPAIVRGEAVTLTWSGSDTGSGLAGYDIAVSADGGPHTPWQVRTTQTHAIYTGQPGHLYRFRITAIDHRGNTASAEAQAGLVHVTKYYAFGGQRVAMRQAGVLYYLHADHLGSTSLATYGSVQLAGQEVLGSRTGYRPFGQVRFGGDGLPTDLTFTSQRNVPGTGLVDYGARFYDPTIGRFISSDTVVQDPGRSASLNRYAYAWNNPLKYADPTGHCVFAPPWDTMLCMAALALVVSGCTAESSADVWVAPQPATEPGTVDMPVSTTWDPYATMATDDARAVTSLTPEVGPPSGSGIGGYRGQTHDLSGDPSRISLATAMRMIRAAFAPGREAPLTTHQFSDLDYVNAMLQDTGWKAKESYLDPDTPLKSEKA